MKTIDLIHPKKIFNDDKRIRLGSFHDGGYVVYRKLLDLSDKLYTFGVGDEISFELDYIKFENKSVVMFDHTVDFNTPEILLNKMQFKKLALAPRKTKHGDTISGHIIEENDQENTKYFIKIDVEGFELDYFSDMVEYKLVDFANCLLVEFHVYSVSDVEKFELAIQNICKHFTCFHIHANNWVSSTFEIDGKTIPSVIEIGFANNRIIECNEKSTDKFPLCGLDYPCKPNHPDIDLNYLFNGE